MGHVSYGCRGPLSRTEGAKSSPETHPNIQTMHMSHQLCLLTCPRSSPKPPSWASPLSTSSWTVVASSLQHQFLILLSPCSTQQPKAGLETNDIIPLSCESLPQLPEQLQYNPHFSWGPAPPSHCPPPLSFGPTGFQLFPLTVPVLACLRTLAHAVSFASRALLHLQTWRRLFRPSQSAYQPCIPSVPLPMHHSLTDIFLLSQCRQTCGEMTWLRSSRWWQAQLRNAGIPTVPRVQACSHWTTPPDHIWPPCQSFDLVLHYAERGLQACYCHSNNTDIPHLCVITSLSHSRHESQDSCPSHPCYLHNPGHCVEQQGWKMGFSRLLPIKPARTQWTPLYTEN